MKTMIFNSRLSVAFILCLILVGCDAWDDDVNLKDPDLNKNLSELIAQDPEISTFAEILKKTGWDERLQNEPSLTVFAPKNEVLTHLNLSDTEALNEWIGNYIAYMSHFTDKDGNFTTDGKVNIIEMVNQKEVPVYPASLVEGKSNMACANGVLHIIDDILEFRKSIWEYLQEQSGYEQVEFIKSSKEQVMDSARSVQTGVDINGKPIYDIVWKEVNTFLETYPLDDERQKMTVVLLDRTAFDAIKAKYAKYMKRDNIQEQEKEIKTQLIGDLVLTHTTINETKRYMSFLDSILVDIDPAHISESYKASNGMVYKLTAADIKIYQNKIKEQIIEGEHFTDRWDGQSAWITRYRSWASGGQDVVLQGRTQQTFNWELYFPENDSTAAMSGNKSFVYSETEASTFIQSSSLNAYIQYEPTLYSCDYKIYWKTYDDINAHRYVVSVPENAVLKADSDSIIQMTLMQKLLISFPGKPVLKRNSDGTITNHFTPYSLMASSTKSGLNEETQLKRYRWNSSITNLELFLVGDSYPDVNDAFGTYEVLKCPTHGKATFFVGNTVSTTTQSYAGLIFLDYIRLVPLVDPND